MVERTGGEHEESAGGLAAMIKISRCRSCDARGVWMLTGEGKNILVEAESVDEADLDFDGATGKPLFDRGLGHEAHFANCPDADQWRHKRQ